MTLPAGRRDEVLDAAVTVLGTGGSRALTHRAVDRVAGLPEGTTSNHFRTRDALVAGVLGRISSREADPLTTELSADGLDVEGLVALAAGRIEALLNEDRVLTVARHALFLEGALHPELRPGLVQESQFWWELGAQLLASLGVPDARRRSRWLFAFLDGVLADQLARPDPNFDAAAAVRAVLTGLLDGAT